MKSRKALFSTGFTLIELLVVIAIIGVLSSVILVALQNARLKGQDSKVRSQLLEVRKAAAQYYSVNGHYGSAVDDGSVTNVTTIGSGCTASSMFVNSLLSNILLKTNYPSFVGGGGLCTSNITGYAVSVPLSTAGQFLCVDAKLQVITRTGPHTYNPPISNGDDCTL